MKTMALIFILLASWAHSVTVAGCPTCIVYYEFTSNGKCNLCSDSTFDLTTVGSLTYGSTGVSGFGGAAYFTTPAALNTALSSLTSYTISYYATMASPNANNTAWVFNDAVQIFANNVLNTGEHIFYNHVTADPGRASAGMAFSGEELLSVTWNNSVNKIYLGNTNKTTTTGSGAGTGTVSAGIIGAYLAGAQPWAGKLRGFVITNTAASSFPVFVPGAAAGTRSLKLRNVVRLKL